MEQSIEIVAAAALKNVMARTFLNYEDSDSSDSRHRVGAVTLHPHQVVAVRRIRDAFDEFGGAILSDEVGMGKTFVALAIARDFRRTLIIAPAALRDMWAIESQRAGIELPFLSVEALGRGQDVRERFDLVIVDEAHHLRNPSTRRYHRLCRIVSRSRVLMLSATPVHNTRRDITALLAIFLGSRAESLTAPQLARCIVRRRVDSTSLSTRLPDTEPLVWKEIDDNSAIPRKILALPPPIPPRDGGDGGVFIARSLLRQWCSSDAALEAALRRRLARSIALTESLQSGHYPTEEELSAWTFAEDSVQLAFTSLVATPIGDAAHLLESVAAHAKALRELLRSTGRNYSRDAMRADVLRAIRAAHPGISIVAFSQYAATVRGLFQEFRTERGVGALTAPGARVAGGVISRREALIRFAPVAHGAKPPREIDRIDLLLTTDLLSEGVNLQDAGVVVHLDLPWTAARLEQRLGRVRRLGSIHKRVHAYAIRPSTAAEALINLERTIERKMREAERSVGGAQRMLPSTRATRVRSPIAAAERIREIFRRWIIVGHACVSRDATLAATVAASHSGFLALVGEEPNFVLLASAGERVTEDPNDILDLLASASDTGRPLKKCAAESIQQRIQISLERMRALHSLDNSTTLVARNRRKLLARIADIAQSPRPHQRQRFQRLASEAREIVLGRLSGAVEDDLLELGSSALPNEEWLEKIIHDGSSSARSRGASSDRIVALLLFEEYHDKTN